MLRQTGTAPSTHRMATVARKAVVDQQVRIVAEVLAVELRMVEPQASREEATMRTLKDVRRISVMVELRLNAEVDVITKEISREEILTKGLRTKIQARDLKIHIQEKEIDTLK